MTTKNRVLWAPKARPSDISVGKPMPNDMAEIWVRFLNKQYPTIHHWIERYEDDIDTQSVVPDAKATFRIRWNRP